MRGDLLIMKLALHFVCMAVLGVAIYFAAWNAYGRAINHIFTHRDTVSTPEEVLVAQRLDRINYIYYLPIGVAVSLVNRIAPEFINSVLSDPSWGREFFIFNAIVWAVLSYGGVLGVILIFRRIHRNGRQMERTD